MNTDAAQTPEVRSNWKAVDIFLFSNGQQYSPPRKYHLKSEDLNWWSLTLNQLARLHYGSLHTNIDLYTTNGKQIQGPLELHNGSAYVAVKTPDVFIDSGYDKYLMKASRSWEKRHSSQSNNVEAKGADDVNIASTNSQCNINIDVTNVKKPVSQNMRNNFKDKSVIRRFTSNIRPKLTTNKLQEPFIKKDAVPNVPYRRYPVLQRNSPATSQIRKSIDKKKDVSANKAQNINIVNTKFNNKNIPILSKDDKMKITLQNQSSITSKHNSLEETTHKNYDNTTSANNTPKTFKSDAETLTIIIDEDDCKLIENNIHLRNTSNNLSDRAMVIQDLLTEVINGVIILKNKSQLSIKNDISTPPKSDNVCMLSKEYEQTQHSKINVIVANTFPQQYGDQMTIISKGVIFHLKLNVEVNNDEIENSTEIERTQETKDDSRMDKISQVEFDVSATVIEDEDKTAHSLLKCDENQEEINVQNSETTVPCHCNNLNFKEIFSEDSKYMVLVLSASRIANLMKCEKCLAKEIVPKYSNELKYNNPVTPFKADAVTSSNIALEENLKTYSAQATCTKSESGRQTTDAKTHVFILDDECIKLNLSIKKLSCHNTNVCETKSNTLNLPGRSFADSSTQTEWCNLLLEARPNKDGHYTFHLPPLQNLKFFNI